MLEKSDLSAIENMFDKFEEKMDQKLDQKLDQRFAEYDKSMDKKLDQRFTEYDQKMDQRFAEQERVMDKKIAKLSRAMDRKRVKSEAFLLDEIERNRNILETRLDRMDRKMDEMTGEIRQLYRITALESERTKIVLEELRQKDSELDERVERLENRAMA